MILYLYIFGSMLATMSVGKWGNRRQRPVAKPLGTLRGGSVIRNIRNKVRSMICMVSVVMHVQ